MRAEDPERQALSERFIAGLVDDRARRISDELDRHAAALEHPERWWLVEELAGIRGTYSNPIPGSCMRRNDRTLQRGEGS